MSFALRLYNRLDWLVSHVGYLAGWLMYPLIAVTVFDVITRRFMTLGSTYLQESEWHLHTVVVMLALGYTYLRNRHVRIDIFRAHWSPRFQAYIELVGVVVFMTAMTFVLVYYGSRFAHIAWVQNEESSSGMGLNNRWAIKAFVPLGGLFLFAGGVGVFLRTILFLFGPEELRERVSEVAASKVDPTKGGRELE